MQSYLTTRVIILRGAIDGDGVHRLWCRCLLERDNGATSVVIDFSRMTDCPSGLLSTLVRINAVLGAAGATLHLVGLSDALSAIVTQARTR